MSVLLRNGTVVNVFTGELERADVLIEHEKIVGVGDYSVASAQRILDVSGKYICPGFVDGHIHIESTTLTPAELARAIVPHGTTSIVADPHEIANVCGCTGIDYILEASEKIPLTVYITLPSCVPATRFDESGAKLSAKDLEYYYNHPRVLGLAEMMDYPGVLANDGFVMEKIRSAQSRGKIVNGHAPLLSGKDLDRYIAAGIRDDHECSSFEEAKERIRKGQRVMIRQGSQAKDLEALLPLFEEPWAHRCMLVTDDIHPADLVENGHIDGIIRHAAHMGKDPITGIRMATLWAAEYFGLNDLGAVAPGYTADILVLDDLDHVSVQDVFRRGVQIVEKGKLIEFEKPAISAKLEQMVKDSFRMEKLSEADFLIDCQEKKCCRVIQLIKKQLLTDESITEIDFSKQNGIDLQRDILKIAVVERHRRTGHEGLGFLSGLEMKHGAIASSVSHDSHNLILIGTNEKDMAAAGNRIQELGGGFVVVNNGEVLCEMPLPIAGLMTDSSAVDSAQQNEQLRESVKTLGISTDFEPFMMMAFSALPVIPHLKLTTMGLVDVDQQKIVPLFAE